MTTEKPKLDTLLPAASVRPRAGVLCAVPAVIVMAPTIALSAFLLFSVEPLVGRLTLPAFGGAPRGWSEALAVEPLPDDFADVLRFLRPLVW